MSATAPPYTGISSTQIQFSRLFYGSLFLFAFPRRRRVSTALHLAGEGALTRVRAGVRSEGTALRRRVAAALHLAGKGVLVRVRADVLRKLTALRRRSPPQRR
jgi:hypothetical protein